MMTVENTAENITVEAAFNDLKDSLEEMDSKYKAVVEAYEAVTIVDSAGRSEVNAVASKIDELNASVVETVTLAKKKKDKLAVLSEEQELLIMAHKGQKVAAIKDVVTALESFFVAHEAVKQTFKAADNVALTEMTLVNFRKISADFRQSSFIVQTTFNSAVSFARRSKAIDDTAKIYVTTAGKSVHLSQTSLRAYAENLAQDLEDIALKYNVK